MGIEGIENLIEQGETIPDSMPESGQICKCGHSKDRHRRMVRDNLVCVERYCKCSNFVLHNIK